MKLYLEKPLLQEAINTTIRAVPAKSSVPALEGLLLDARGETLTVLAYNMKLGIRTRYNAEIEREGRIVVNAKLFSEIVRKMPDDTVTLECDENYAMSLDCGNTHYNIMAMSADEYPELPEIGETESLEIAEVTLKSMIGDTIFAVSTNEARPVQTGELFEVENGNLHIVACDGFRLALRTEPVESGNTEFVVPGSTLGEVNRLCSNAESPVRISVGDRHVMFFIGETELITRRLDGEFIAWRNVIPKNNPIKVKVDAREMAQAVERVSVVVNDKMKSPMRCRIGSGVITLSTKTALGAAVDRCKVEGDGGDLEIGFNNRYMGEVFRFVPENELTMSFNTPVAATGSLPTWCCLCGSKRSDKR